jgi:hypothetical protein
MNKKRTFGMLLFAAASLFLSIGAQAYDRLGFSSTAKKTDMRMDDLNKSG